MPDDLSDIEVTCEQVTIDQTGSIAVINNKDLAGALKSRFDEVREQELEWEVTFQDRLREDEVIAELHLPTESRGGTP